MMGSAQQTDKPYKPKFHKAVLYNEQQQRSSPHEGDLRNGGGGGGDSESLEANAPPPSILGNNSTAVSWSRGAPMVHESRAVPIEHPYQTMVHQIPNLTRVLPTQSANVQIVSAVVTSSENPKVVANAPISVSGIPPRLSHLVSVKRNSLTVLSLIALFGNISGVTTLQSGATHIKTNIAE